LSGYALEMTVKYRSPLTEMTVDGVEVLIMTLSDSSWSTDVSRLSRVSHLIGRACMCCSNHTFTFGINELSTDECHSPALSTNKDVVLMSKQAVYYSAKHKQVVQLTQRDCATNFTA